VEDEARRDSQATVAMAKRETAGRRSWGDQPRQGRASKARRTEEKKETDSPSQHRITNAFRSARRPSSCSTGSASMNNDNDIGSNKENDGDATERQGFQERPSLSSATDEQAPYPALPRAWKKASVAGSKVCASSVLDALDFLS